MLMNHNSIFTPNLLTLKFQDKIEDCELIFCGLQTVSVVAALECLRAELMLKYLTAVACDYKNNLP